MSTALTVKFHGVDKLIRGEFESSSVADIINALAEDAKQAGRFAMFLLEPGVSFFNCVNSTRLTSYRITNIC